MPPTRRNLFQSHLSRRPASGAPSTSASTSSNSSNNSNTIPPAPPLLSQPITTTNPTNDASFSGLPPASQQQHIQPSSVASSANTTATSLIDNGEIIARDKHGKFQLDIPVLPPIQLDEKDEEDEEDDGGMDDGGAMEGIEDDGHGHGRASAGSGGSGSNGNAAMSSELVGRDKEKLEAGLVEMMYRNRNRHLNGEPEILNLIQQSLRNKVASLEEDNWMFEMEDDPQV